MNGKYFEELAVGERMTTAGRTVTEADVVLFATLTGNYNPYCLDEEVAAKSFFKGRIAPGPLTLAVTSGLMFQRFMEGTLLAASGMDEVRFLSPVRIGDTLRVECEVLGKKETSQKDRGLVVVKGTTLNQRGESVFEAKWNLLMLRQTPFLSFSSSLVPLRALAPRKRKKSGLNRKRKKKH